VQVRVIPVREHHIEYSQKVYDALKAAGIRAEFAAGDEGLGKKVRASKVEKIPYWLVIGDKEIAEQAVTVEHLDRGQLGQQQLAQFIETITTDIKNKA
jgi:threonyl-tRNA synthetase